MAEKKAPLRRCLGCMESKAKKELIRVVKNNQNELFIDLTGKKNGRGAYLCNSTECFAKMRRAKRLERAFETAIPDEIYEKLEIELGTKND